MLMLMLDDVGQIEAGDTERAMSKQPESAARAGRSSGWGETCPEQLCTASIASSHAVTIVDHNEASKQASKEGREVK